MILEWDKVSGDKMGVYYYFSKVFVSDNMFYQFPTLVDKHFCVEPSVGINQILCTFYNIFLQICFKILCKNVQKHWKRRFRPVFGVCSNKRWSKYTTLVSNLNFFIFSVFFVSTLLVCFNPFAEDLRVFKLYFIELLFLWPNRFLFAL